MQTKCVFPYYNLCSIFLQMLFHCPYYSSNYNGGFAEQSYYISPLSFPLCRLLVLHLQHQKVC